ncbi:hypothetical protein ACRAWF_28260 [Streptomyces sp. L7]
MPTLHPSAAAGGLHALVLPEPQHQHRPSARRQLPQSVQQRQPQIRIRGRGHHVLMGCPRPLPPAAAPGLVDEGPVQHPPGVAVRRLNCRTRRHTAYSFASAVCVQILGQVPVPAQQMGRTPQMRLPAAREVVEVQPAFDDTAGTRRRPVRPASGSQATSTRHRRGAR